MDIGLLLLPPAGFDAQAIECHTPPVDRGLAAPVDGYGDLS